MSHPPRVIWAYTYRLVPPQPAERLREVKALLAHEHQLALENATMWEGRLVVDERTSHILVLSDTPDLDHGVNERLESALRAIDAGFAITVPLAVDGAADAPGAPKAAPKGAIKAATKVLPKVKPTPAVTAAIAAAAAAALEPAPKAARKRAPRLPRKK